MASTGTDLDRMIERLEQAEGLDAVAKPLAELVQRAVAPQPVRDFLSGTWLGHSLHPLLTDIPIGAWVSATALDLVGGRSSRRAARRLVGLGILAALPTAAAGANDWSDTMGGPQRVGLVHAAGNLVGLGLQLASWRARGKGHHLRGRAWSLGALGAMTVSGYLGGHLSYVNGVTVNRTAFEEGPTDWALAAAEDELTDGVPHRVDLDGVAVVLVRQGSEIHAISATCSHLGGPLDEGAINDGCVTCPWHGSVFRLADGAVESGPATVPQPRFETRVLSGKIEVRRASV